MTPTEFWNQFWALLEQHKPKLTARRQFTVGIRLDAEKLCPICWLISVTKGIPLLSEDNIRAARLARKHLGLDPFSANDIMYQADMNPALFNQAQEILS